MAKFAFAREHLFYTIFFFFKKIEKDHEFVEYIQRNN